MKWNVEEVRVLFALLRSPVASRRRLDEPAKDAKTICRLGSRALRLDDKSRPGAIAEIQSLAMAYGISVEPPRGAWAGALVLHLPRWAEVCDGMHNGRFSVPGNPHRSRYPTDAAMSAHEVRVLVLLSRLPAFAEKRDADNARSARAIASFVALLLSPKTAPLGRRQSRQRLHDHLAPYGARLVDGPAAAEIGAVVALSAPCSAPSTNNYLSAMA